MTLFTDIFNYVSDIFRISSISFYKIVNIFILVLIGSSLDILSIGLIIPFVAVLFNGSSNFFLIEILDINAENQFIAIILVLLFTLILRSVFLILISYLQTKYSQHVVINLRSNLLSSYFKDEYTEYKKKKISQFVYSINDLSGRFESIFLNLLKTLSDLFFAIVIIIFLSSLEFIFILFFIIGITLWIILYDRIFGKLILKYGEENNFYTKKIIRSITEAFTGFKEIILLNCKEIFRIDLNNSSKKLAEFIIKYNVIRNLQAQVLELLTGMIILFSIMYLFIIGTEASAIIGKMGVFAVGLFRLKPIIGTINGAMSDYRYNRDVMRILNNDLEKFYEKKYQPNLNINNKIKINNIELKNVSFSFEKNKKIINNLNIVINEGDVIGVKGISGSGKTTFLDILSGLIKPNEGQIIINQNPKITDVIDLKNYIGYVPQDSFIMDDDIASNVAVELDKTKINFEKINKSLTQAGLGEFIHNLNKHVGEKGSLLSGGQKQRLVIARQFYKEKPILILDESTNALDKNNEELILTNLVNLKEKPILILVSHSLDLNLYCNKIINL